MKRILFLSLFSLSAPAFSQEEEPVTTTEDGTPVIIEQSADALKLDEIEDLMEKKEKTAISNSNAAAPAAAEKKNRRYKSYWNEIITDLENKEVAPEEDTILRPDEVLLRKMEKGRDVISEDISDLASRIDSFFINEPVIYGRNTTNIRLLNTLTVREEEGLGGNIAVKARLKLPRLKEKLQFEIDRQVDEYQVGGSSNQAGFRGGGLSQNTRTGLSFYFHEFFNFKTKLTGGAEWNHGPVPYVNLRISNDFKINDKQKFTFIENIFTDTKNKSGESSIFYYDITVAQNLLFRVINDATYRDLHHTFQTSHGLVLFHEINSRNAMYYSASMHGANPAERNNFYSVDYIAATTWRHRMYKNFLYGEITPAMVWARTKQWEGLPEISIRLEIIFGKI